MKKIICQAMVAMTLSTIGAGCARAQDKASEATTELPKVYFIKAITSENLVKIYKALGRKAEGNV